MTRYALLWFVTPWFFGWLIARDRNMPDIVVDLLNLAAISVLMWVFYGPYRRFRTDLLRSRLFQARDRLFAAAEKGAMSFDDRAYGMTRQMLNGMIRFAHDISLWTLVVIALSLRYWNDEHERDAYWQRYVTARSALSKRGQLAVNAAMAEAHFAMLSNVLHTSLLTFPFAIMLKGALRLLSVGKSLARATDRRLPRRAREILDREAYLLGDSDARRFSSTRV